MSANSKPPAVSAPQSKRFDRPDRRLCVCADAYFDTAVRAQRDESICAIKPEVGDWWPARANFGLCGWCVGMFAYPTHNKKTDQVLKNFSLTQTRLHFALDKVSTSCTLYSIVLVDRRKQQKKVEVVKYASN